MGVLNMTLEEMESKLVAVGNPSALTAPYGSLVEAVNELFSSASKGKEAIVAALTGSGVDAATTETFVELAQKIVMTSIKGRIVNCDTLTASGTNATSAYYNVEFGVKLGLMYNGDIIVAMQGGTNTGYETLNFLLGNVPDGVTITAVDATASSNATAKIGMVYACVLHGVTMPCEMTVSVVAGSSTYDNTNVTIDLTEVS